ncbi:MAG: hypothetical protein OXM03_06560 [Chloroflexota bacterium]|nr:hypothetical protein [Chloroflexota bacterium]MDE2840274.1 hypothetical protein [Chloroflexota bacterium]MDE2930362.1 hypothetical protein [Chloroflexota bacterium]
MSLAWLWRQTLVVLVITVVTLASLPALHAQQTFSHGAVVALRGTPHLWIADARGVLHWGGDTRALAGKNVNWNDRTEVTLEQLRGLTVGDPWLSAGLLKDGDPIYLVKWESDWERPQLLHIQSIADVELFGIDGSNYGRFVLDKATWEARYGMSAASLQRSTLPAAVPTATPTPTPTDSAQKDVVFSRNLEYGYSISVSDDWIKSSEGVYKRNAPWSRIRILPHQFLAIDSSPDQFAKSVRGLLGKSWWNSPPSLFEITSFQEKQLGERAVYLFKYRIQSSPQYCVLDVIELVAWTNSLPGNPQGYRMRVYMCEHDVPTYELDRMEILESFRIITRPATYYTQFLYVNGIMIKSASEVDPDAFYSAADMIAPMLSGRQDIAECMTDVGSEVVIIPKDEKLTTLPEFRHLEEKRTFDDRSYQNIRGTGATKSQRVTATSEESLLGLKENNYQYIALVTVHEFAHSIQNLCFTEGDHSRWNAYYDYAVEANIFPGEYLMSNNREFFAVFTTAYFEVTGELGPNSSRNLVESEYPAIFLFLDEIYGSTELSPESKRLTPR